MCAYILTRLWDSNALCSAFEICDDEALVYTTILVFSGGYFWRQRGKLLAESKVWADSLANVW